MLNSSPGKTDSTPPNRTNNAPNKYTIKTNKKRFMKLYFLKFNEGSLA